ncbi:MAG: hypothetical protein J7J79_00590 [Thermoplasmata archaeon]|nr:hypothetical protein [Thermoplasmata archaeon]
MDLREALAYIAHKTGGTNPFRASRILVLANWLAQERLGRSLVRFRITGFEAGFAVEGLKPILDDPCFERDKVEKRIRWRCEPPRVEHREILDDAIQIASGLDDLSLNRLIIRDARYRKLLEEGGFQ